MINKFSVFSSENILELHLKFLFSDPNKQFKKFPKLFDPRLKLPKIFRSNTRQSCKKTFYITCIKSLLLKIAIGKVTFVNYGNKLSLAYRLFSQKYRQYRLNIASCASVFFDPLVRLG